MSSTDSPNRIIYYQVQEYTFYLLKRKKVAFDYSSLKFNLQVLQVVESVVTVDLDESDKIIRLVDQWNGADLPTRFGASLLRTLNAKVVPWLIHVPKA